MRVLLVINNMNGLRLQKQMSSSFLRGRSSNIILSSSTTSTTPFRRMGTASSNMIMIRGNCSNSRVAGGAVAGTTTRTRILSLRSNCMDRNSTTRRHNTTSSTGSPSKGNASQQQEVHQTVAGTGRMKPGPAGLYERTRDRGPVSWPSLFLVGVAAASAVAYYRIERERRLESAMGKVVSSESDGWTPRPDYLAKRKFVATKWGYFPVEDGFGAPGKPAIGGPWSLVDLDGNLVTNKSFEGKWLLLYFGFARCPDICPSEMMKVGRVIDTLKKDYPELAKKITPVFVSVDPARDSLQALKAYAQDFHPDYVFLTGSPVQVQQMAKKYRVYVSKADETADGDYLVDHSIVIYFHDDTGDLADCFTQSMRATDVVDKVVERMTFQPSY